MSDHMADIESRLESLTTVIVNAPHTNDRHSLNLVYNKIVFYIILNSGLGTPDKPSVVSETRAALTSVFHFYAVKPFLKKSQEEKREQLQQLTNIVMGIRLFYWHYGEYGDGIENIPDALVKGLNKSIHDLVEKIKKIEYQVHTYKDALWHHYKIDIRNNVKNTEKDCYSEGRNPIENNFKADDVDDVNYVKSTINILHQYIQFLSDILNVLKYSQQSVSKTIEEFHEALVDLQKFTKYKNKYIVTEYVPTDVVVHKFTNVASFWKTLWKYLVSLHLLNDLDETLSRTFKQMKLPSLDLISYFIGESQEATELKKQYRERIDEKQIVNPKCKLVDFNPDVLLKFHGFSALILILEGFLVPGKVELGIIQYGNEAYSFSSPEEAYVFCQNVDNYLKKLLETVRQYPELIDFFNMKDILFNIKEQNTSMEPIKCETGIQTEVHPIPHFNDKNYHFNAYELMRRHWKKTQSYLTCENKSTKTCLLVDMSTQTYDMRSVSTQECDKATSMSRPVRYIYGLRGFNNDSVIQDEDYVPLLNLQL